MNSLLEQIFLQVCGLSGIASLLFLCFLLTKPFFLKKQTFSWQYALLKGILLCFLLPYTLLLTPLLQETLVGKLYLTEKSTMQWKLEKEMVTKLEESQKNYLESMENSTLEDEILVENTEITPETTEYPENRENNIILPPSIVIGKSDSQGFISILAKIWFFVVALLFIWYSYCHFTFQREKKTQLDLESRLPVYLQENLQSPVLSGLFHAKILLPSQECLQYFSYISLHEETHFKRKDIFFKLLLLIAKVIHWYNPLLYYFSKVFEETLELSCDEVATKNMDFQQRKNYGLALLSVSKDAKKQPSLCLGFSHTNIGNKLKRRVEFMMKPMKKSSKIITAISFIVILIVLSGFAFLGMKENVGKFVQFLEPSPEQLTSPEGENAVVWLSEYRFTLTDEMAETLDFAPQLFLSEEGRYLLKAGENLSWQGNWNVEDHTNSENSPLKIAVLYLEDQFSMTRLTLDITTDTWGILSKSEFLEAIHPDMNIQSLSFHSMTPFSQDEWDNMNQEVEYQEAFYHQPFTQGMGDGMGLWDKGDGLSDYLYIRNLRATKELQEILDYDRIYISFKPAMDTLRVSVWMQDKEVFSQEEIQAVIDVVLAMERTGENLVIAEVSGYFSDDKFYLHHEEGMKTGNYVMELPPSFAEEGTYWYRSISLFDGGKASMNFTQGWVYPCYGIYCIRDGFLYFFDDLGDGITADFIFEIKGENQLVFVSERENNREYVLDGEEKLQTGDVFYFMPEGEEAPVVVGDPEGFSTEANDALTNLTFAMGNLLDNAPIHSSFGTVGKKIEADFVLTVAKAKIEGKLEEIIQIVAEYESDVFTVNTIKDEDGNLYYSREE